MPAILSAFFNNNLLRDVRCSTMVTPARFKSSLRLKKISFLRSLLTNFMIVTGAESLFLDFSGWEVSISYRDIFLQSNFLLLILGKKR